MERRKRWDAAAAKETAVFRKYEKRYFHKKLAYRIVLGLFLYGFGVCLILSLYLTAEEQYRNRRYENIFMTALLNQKNVNGDTEISRSRQLYRRDSHLECTLPGRVRLLSLFPGSEPSGISEKIPVLQENSLRWKRRFQNQRLCGFDDRGG